MPTWDQVIQILDRLTVNQVTTFLVVTLLMVYFLFLGYRIYKIHQYYTSVFMEFVEDELYSIHRLSSERVRQLIKDTEWSESPFFMVAYKGVLHTALFMRTKTRIKRMHQQNGYHHLTGDDLKQYKIKMGKRLKNKNQSDMLSLSENLYDFIDSTHHVRFSYNESIETISRIIDEDIRLDKLKKKAIFKAIFFKGEDCHA